MKKTSSINFLFILFIFLFNSNHRCEIFFGSNKKKFVNQKMLSSEYNKKQMIEGKLFISNYNKEVEVESILSNSFLQYSDMNILRSPLENFYIQLEADPKAPAPTKPASAANNSTAPANKTSTLAASTTPAASANSAADAAKAKEEAGAKAKLQAASERDNAKIKELETKVDEHSKAIEGIKNLNTHIDKLSQQVNDTQQTNHKILGNLKDLKADYNRLMFKVQTDSIQTDKRLSDINTNLQKQVQNQLTLQVYSLTKELDKIEDEIKLLDKKIKSLKRKVPNSNSMCGMYGSCSSCVTNSQCGWCSMTQTCVEGNAKGPLDGSCSFYDYNVCSGPKECSDYKGCKVKFTHNINRTVLVMFHVDGAVILDLLNVWRRRKQTQAVVKMIDIFTFGKV